MAWLSRAKNSWQGNRKGREYGTKAEVLRERKTSSKKCVNNPI